MLGRRGEDTFNKIYASADNGITWQEMTSLAHRLSWVQNVSVDPWRAGQIWVGGSHSFEIINLPATSLTTMPTVPSVEPLSPRLSVSTSPVYFQLANTTGTAPITLVQHRQLRRFLGMQSCLRKKGGSPL